MTQFGDFEPLCHDTPSYPWCNLFYRQLLRLSPQTLRGTSNLTVAAPVGVNPECGIPRLGHDGSISNVANIAACGVSVVIVLGLMWAAARRKAAVGRVEQMLFLLTYTLTLPLQLLTTGSLLEQGSTALVVLTAIHAGVVAALFYGLIVNAVVATQVVEDGTMTSLVPYGLISLLIFGGTTYISLDVALGITETLGGLSNPPERLKSIPLFVLLNIWPAATAVVYLLLMTYIVLKVLNETRPMWFYVLAGALFVLAQLAWFLLGRVVCRGSNERVDGSFIATILETASVCALYLGWRSITEESWDDAPYPTGYAQPFGVYGR